MHICVLIFNDKIKNVVIMIKMIILSLYRSLFLSVCQMKNVHWTFDLKRLSINDQFIRCKGGFWD